MPRSAGRPLEFDPAIALGQILGVFWEHGYERTSLAQIEEATGLSRPSIYNTFGDKRSLFESAANAYYESMESFIDEHLRQRDDGIEAIVNLIDALLVEYQAGDHAPGCVLVNAMAEFGTVDPFVTEVSARYTGLLARGIEDALGRAAQLREIEEPAIGELTRRTVLLLFGLNLVARAKGSGDEIAQFAESAKGSVRSWGLRG